MSKQQQRWLNAAIELAKNSNCRQKHGAIIVKGGNVLGMGVNKNRNHPTITDPSHIKMGCSTCAERVAIKNAGNVKGATVYVARVNNLGQPMYSRPCDRCTKVMIRAGIKAVIYT